MLKRTFMFCILLIAVLLPCLQTRAEPRPPPEPWYIEFSNGKTFHMTPEGFEEYGYPQSGLYYNDELLFSVITYFTSYESYFAYDGMSYIHMPYAAWERAAIFVSFGERQRVYTLEDLLSRPEEISETTIGFIWDDWQLRQHDFENNTLQVTTEEGQQITFNLRNGEMTKVTTEEGQQITFNLRNGEMTKVNTTTIIWIIIPLILIIVVVIITVIKIKSKQLK
jgi:hypothetical protein